MTVSGVETAVQGQASASASTSSTSASSSSREIVEETKVTSSDGTVTITTVYSDGTKTVRVTPGDSVEVSAEKA